MRRMLILAMVSVMILAIGCSAGLAGGGIDYLALVNKLHPPLFRRRLRHGRNSPADERAG